MIPAHHNSVVVDFDKAKARLKMSNVNAFDDHDLANSLSQGQGLPANPAATPPTPAIPPIFPVRAKVSFDIEWNGAIVMAPISNTTPPDHFRGTFFSTNTTISWSSEQEGFTFKSEPTNQQNLISVLGREQNGVFFS